MQKNVLNYIYSQSLTLYFAGNVVVLQHAESKPGHHLSINEDKDLITFTTHKSVSESIQQSRHPSTNTITVTTCRPSIIHKVQFVDAA